MMNQDHFDWAALAQQWIQKNSCSIPNNSSDIPEPPPPPIISSNVAQHLSKKYEEQGEADMEVVKDDDEHIQMHQQQQPNFIQINDGFSSGPTIVQPQVWFGPPQNQQIPYCNPWNHWQGPGNVVLPPPQLHIPPVTQINIIRDQVLPIPPLIKSDSGQQIEDTTPVIDAAKRKTLPAWIREGLEKMEREKLKQMEKLKTTSDNTNTKNKSQWSDDDDDNNNTNYIINTKLNDDDPIIGSKPIKSSFDLKNIVKSSPANSDSENSADEDMRSNNNFPQQFENKKSSPELQIKKSIKSYDEIVEELMLVVRRSLTEILLEVTTEEILNISQETYKKYKLKASSAQVFRKSALSSITGKLGLGAYADSASSDENISDSSDDENGKNSDQENDSEAELRENIRNRQNAFKIIAQEIDSLVLQEEARNEKTKERRSTERSYSSTKGLYSGSGNSSGGGVGNNSTLSSSVSRYVGDKEFGETQHTDKKSLSNGKRPKERTSRFSDNKDSRHKSASSSSSHYLVPTTASIQTIPPAPTFLITNQSKSSSTTTELDDKSYSSTSRKHRRSSNSSSNESKSSSRRSSSYRRRHRYDSEHSTGTSSRHNKKTSKEDDKYSSSRYKKHDNSNDSSSSRKGRRRRHNHEGNSSDSDDYYHSHRKNSNSNSEIIKSARKIRSRSRSKSKTTSIRSRSRSRSRSSYSSSRRYDRY